MLWGGELTKGIEIGWHEVVLEREWVPRLLRGELWSQGPPKPPRASGVRA